MQRLLDWFGKLFEYILLLSLTPAVLIVGILMWFWMKGLDYMYDEDDYD